MRVELRFSGSGGQGLITATRIIARAALREGKMQCNPSLMELRQEVVLLKVK